MNEATQRRLEAAAQTVANELKQAIDRFPPMRSAHEGFAILKEEVDELWDEVKRGTDKERMRAEARQVAAMAIRFMIDVCEG